MKLRALIITVVVLAALAVGIVFANNADAVFFDTMPWATIVAAGAGLVLGAIYAMFKDKEYISQGEVKRHGSGGFVAHWGTALGIFTLLASGILLGFLFFPHIMDTPEKAIFSLNIHFVGVMVALFCGFFFAGDYLLTRDIGKLIPNIPDLIAGFIAKEMLKREWKNEGKYLSSQKGAFLGFAALGALILITGAVKVAAHMWAIDADWWAFFTIVHDFTTLLFMVMLFIHIVLVVAMPAHWPLLTSWITGKITEEYAEEEHPIWHDELKTGKHRGYKLLG